MRLIFALLLCLAIPEFAAGQEDSGTTSDLHVLFLGRNDDSPRQESFSKFLEKHFAKVTLLKRSEFDHTKPCDADVVILDWSQREERTDDYPSPLGELEDWSTPTVLLGSAGLFMAGPWSIAGGAG